MIPLSMFEQSEADAARTRWKDPCHCQTTLLQLAYQHALVLSVRPVLLPRYSKLDICT